MLPSPFTSHHCWGTSGAMGQTRSTMPMTYITQKFPGKSCTIHEKAKVKGKLSSKKGQFNAEEN